MLLPPLVMRWEWRCGPSDPASAFSLELIPCTSDIITHKFTFSSSVTYKSHSVAEGDKEGCVKCLRNPNFFSHFPSVRGTQNRMKHSHIKEKKTLAFPDLHGKIDT